MSVVNTLEEKAAGAKAFGQGNNINPWAVYELEIVSIRGYKGFNRKLNAETDYCTPEFKVVSCEPTKSEAAFEAAKVPLTKRPNGVGSTCGSPWPVAFDWASGAMVKFLTTLTGESQEELTKKHKIGDKEMSGIAYLVSDDQPAKGCRIMCEATDKPIKGKDGSNPDDLRTRLKFFHTSATKAATEKILG